MFFYVVLLYLLVEIFTQLLEVDDDGRVYKFFGLLVGGVIAAGEIIFLNASYFLILFVPLSVFANIVRRMLFSISKLEDLNMFKLILTIVNIAFNIYIFMIVSNFIDSKFTIDVASNLLDIKYEIYILLGTILGYEILQRYFEKGTDVLNIEFDSYGPMIISVLLGIFGLLMSIFAFTGVLDSKVILQLFIGYTIIIVLLTFITSTVLDEYEDDFNITYFFPVLFGLIIISSIFFA